MEEFVKANIFMEEIRVHNYQRAKAGPHAVMKMQNPKHPEFFHAHQPQLSFNTLVTTS